ncbi:MAG TPA: 30S ribosomal protein S6e [archaeon]|nr:30S ribosomal protein S6e [archaeon]
MASFKFVISDGKKSYQVEKDQKDAPIFGKKIGEKFEGQFLGMDGYELQITGGSDKDGFPMRNDIEGNLRRRFLVTKGIGYSGTKKEKKRKYKLKGVKRRKTLRGNTIADDISQINCKVIKAGSKPLEELFPSAKKEEAKAEA